MRISPKRLVEKGPKDAGGQHLVLRADRPEASLEALRKAGGEDCGLRRTVRLGSGSAGMGRAGVPSADKPHREGTAWPAAGPGSRQPLRRLKARPSSARFSLVNSAVGCLWVQ